MDSNITLIVNISIAIIALFFAIVFSLAEHSFSKLNSSDVKWLSHKGDKKSKMLLELLQKGYDLVAAMELWKLFSILTVVFACNLALVKISAPYFHGYLLVIINITVIFLLIIVFVFLVPKIYAENHILLVSRGVTPLVAPFYNLIRPISRWWGRLKKQQQNEILKEEDNPDAYNLDKDSYEYQVLKRINQFPSKLVQHVLRPRVEMFAFDKNIEFSEVKRKVAEVQYSRIPVYESELDNIIGILYAKDLMPYYDKEEFYWPSLLQTPLYVNIDLQLIDLLNRFQVKRAHMAIVVDEFGGCLGLVTMEDIIEVITGEIQDEFDFDQDYFKPISKDRFLINPKISMDNLLSKDPRFDSVFRDYKNMKVESLNGFLLQKFSKLPSAGEKLELHNAYIYIDSVAASKIDKVTLVLE